MDTITVSLGKRSYQIIVGKGALRGLGTAIRKLKLGTHAYVITNSLIRKKHAQALATALRHSRIKVHFKEVADSEKSKSIETASSVLRDLAHYARNKNVFVIAFGGGVVGDLSGFVASVYKRGVPYVQVPTTLLAQVDSAIGGKTALDLTEAKNMVGAIYQPRLVISDTSLLKTLSLRQVQSGLAEAVKYGVIKDAKLFSYLEKNYASALALKDGAIRRVVSCCSRIKAAIVGEDEREERGIRTVLNFGHTAGHALEAAGGYHRLNHGEAIAIGMLVALEISLQMGLITPRVLARIEGLISRIGLPTKAKKIPLKKILQSLKHDKKFKGRKNRFVLSAGIGRTVIKEGIAPALIEKALRKRLQ